MSVLVNDIPTFNEFYNALKRCVNMEYVLRTNPKVIDGNIYTGNMFKGYELEMLEIVDYGSADIEIILSLYSYENIERKFVRVCMMEKLIGMFGADKILKIYNEMKESNGNI